MWSVMLSAIGLIAAFLWALASEPRYQGKTAQQWLEEVPVIPRRPGAGISSHPDFVEWDAPATKAILAMRKDAVPTLIRAYHPSRSGFQAWLMEWERRLRQSPEQPDMKFKAWHLLNSLGPEAASAMTELCQCVVDPGQSDPTDAVAIIGAIHSRPDIGVPTLINFMKSSSNPDRLFEAAKALGKYGTAASNSVPLLVIKWRALEGHWPSSDIAAAIKQIDPATAAKEGIH